jgi:hypothetical protein
MDTLSRHSLIAGLIVLPVGLIGIVCAIAKTPMAIHCSRVDAKSEVEARLHCSRVSAERQTPESLVRAIKLVRTIPDHAPLHQEGTRLIEQWSNDLLTQADRLYQAGDLGGAIAIAESLPLGLPKSELAREKTQIWRLTWTHAQTIEKDILTRLQKGEWQQAFQLADQLQHFGNNYWSKERYTALIEKIHSNRELRDWTLNRPNPRSKSGKLAIDSTGVEQIRPTSVSTVASDAVQKTVAGQKSKASTVPVPPPIVDSLPASDLLRPSIGQ